VQLLKQREAVTNAGLTGLDQRVVLLEEFLVSAESLPAGPEKQFVFPEAELRFPSQDEALALQTACLD
jgi:hypothetical protein